MKRWSEFAAEKPEMAEAGRTLFLSQPGSRRRVLRRRTCTARRRRRHPAGGLRDLHRHGCLHEQRYALRAVARASAARQVRTTPQLASRLHEVDESMSALKRRITS